MSPCSSFFWWGKSPSPTGRWPKVWIDRSFIWITHEQDRHKQYNKHEASCKSLSCRSDASVKHTEWIQYIHSVHCWCVHSVHSSHFLLWSPRLPLCSPCQRGCVPAGFPRWRVWWTPHPLKGSAGCHSAQFLPELYRLLLPVVHYCCPGKNLDKHTNTWVGEPKDRRRKPLHLSILFTSPNDNLGNLTSFFLYSNNYYTQ